MDALTAGALMGGALGGRVGSSVIIGKFGSASFFPLLCCGLLGFLLCGVWPTSLPALFVGLVLNQVCTLLPVLNLFVCSYLNNDLEKSESSNRWVNFMFFLGNSSAVLLGGDQFGWRTVASVGAACTTFYASMTACDPWIRAAACGRDRSHHAAPSPPAPQQDAAAPAAATTTGYHLATTSSTVPKQRQDTTAATTTATPPNPACPRRTPRRRSVRSSGTRLPWSALLIAVSLMISCLLYGIVVSAGLWRTATAFRFSAGLNGALLAGGDALPSVLLALTAVAKPLLRRVAAGSGQGSGGRGKSSGRASSSDRRARLWRRMAAVLTQRPCTLLLPLLVQAGAVSLLATPSAMAAAVGIVVSEFHHCVIMSSHTEAFLSLCDRERIAGQLSILTISSKVMYSLGGFLGPPLTLLSPTTPFLFALCLATGWAAVAAALYALRTHQLLRRGRRGVPTDLCSSSTSALTSAPASSSPICSSPNKQSPGFAPSSPRAAASCSPPMLVLALTEEDDCSLPVAAAAAAASGGGGSSGGSIGGSIGGGAVAATEEGKEAGVEVEMKGGSGNGHPTHDGGQGGDIIALELGGMKPRRQWRGGAVPILSRMRLALRGDAGLRGGSGGCAASAPATPGARQAPAGCCTGGDEGHRQQQRQQHQSSSRL